MKQNKTFSYKEVTFIVIFTSIIMCFLGCVFVYRNIDNLSYITLSKDENMQKFIAAYNDLLNNYYDDLNSEELIEGAINGLYSSVGDPYTTYLNEDNSNLLSSSLSGNYDGIGVVILKNEEGIISISKVYENTPASNAGIIEGDILLEVNDITLEGLDIDEIADMIKKSVNYVKLKCLRGEELLEFNVKIEKLLMPVVEGKTLEKDNHKVGYIKLSIFNSTSDTQFKKELKKLEKEKFESLIIDLRNNTGGYLQAATRISEIFLKKGEKIYTLESKNSKEVYKDTTGEKRNYPIFVLINEKSASASEILAAALKYSYGAKLVGTKSYGKGKVQEVNPITDKSSLKYTTAKWLTPNDICIDGVGLEPDENITLNEKEYKSGDIYTDSQITKALDIMFP